MQNLPGVLLFMAVMARGNETLSLPETARRTLFMAVMARGNETSFLPLGAVRVVVHGRDGKGE